MSCIRGLRGIPSVPTSQDPARTLRWRRQQLMAAGLDELSAHRLAARTDMDIHAVLTLKDTAVDAAVDTAVDSAALSLLEQMDAMDQDSSHV